MESKYQWVVGDRRKSLTKPIKATAAVWVGIELTTDADGDAIVIAKTEDGKHTSDFWIGEWLNEMVRA